MTEIGHNDMADIIGKVLRTTIELLNASPWTFHLKHLIALAYVNDQRIHHQVCPEGYLRCIKTILHEEILEETGVEHDVSVIRYIKILLVRI